MVYSKPLSLQQMLLSWWWCFPVVVPTTDGRPVRLIASDGRVRVYRRPVRASEVMAENPRHLVCRSDAFYIGRRVPALSPADELQPGHSYFLLPATFFHSVLTFVAAAASLAAPSSGKAGGLLRPFDVHKTAAGGIQIRVKEVEEVAEEEEEKGSVLCTTAALEKDYRQLVRCKSRQWRPKLETIRESDRRRRGGGGGVFVVFKRSRKKKTIQ